MKQRKLIKHPEEVSCGKCGERMMWDDVENFYYCLNDCGEFERK